MNFVKSKVVGKDMEALIQKGVKFLLGSDKTGASGVFDSYIKYVGGSGIVVLVVEMLKEVKQETSGSCT